MASSAEDRRMMIPKVLPVILSTVWLAACLLAGETNVQTYEPVQFCGMTPPNEDPDSQSRIWSPELLHDVSHWPHAANDVHLTATPKGLQVTVAKGRKFAIAAMSKLNVPSDMHAFASASRKWAVEQPGLCVCTGN